MTKLQLTKTRSSGFIVQIKYTLFNQLLSKWFLNAR